MPALTLEPEFLLSVEIARDMLNASRKVDEVKDIHDKAEAMRLYYRKRGASLEAMNTCAEIKLLAERRLGELTRELPTRPGKRTDKEPSNSVSPGSKSAILDDMGASKMDASRWEAVAAVPEARFEAYIAETKEAGEELTTAGVLRLAHTSGADDYDGDEWYTPPTIVECARRVLGGIDLDPASNLHAQTTVQATLFFSKEDDALLHEWHGRVFCNPPYSMPLIRDFTKKLLEEYDTGRVTSAIYLVNNCTDAKWCQTLLARGMPICLTDGRIRFMNRKGQQFATRQGQIIFYLGDDRKLFRGVFSDVGAIR